MNLYVDRLEILNPGGLYGTVTVDRLGTAGMSSARNQHLSALLEVTLPVTEMGTLRKIVVPDISRFRPTGAAAAAAAGTTGFIDRI